MMKNFFINNNNKKLLLKLFSYKTFFNKIINIVNIVSNSYKYDNKIYNNKILEYKNGTITFNINTWSNNVNNKRDADLLNKVGYSEEIFKSYYRYMIPLFIYKSYKSFIYYLNYKNSFINIKTSLFSKYN